jgi:hypothetical protein
MWHTALTVVLWSSLMWPQHPNAAVAGVQTASQDELTHKELPKMEYVALTEWQQIPRGKSEKAAVIVFNHGAIVAPFESSAGLVPAKIEFEEAQGLKVADFHFPIPQIEHFAFQDQRPAKPELNDPPAIHGTNGHGRIDMPSPEQEQGRITIQYPRLSVLSAEFPIEFKLKVSNQALLGQHVLHGKLTYQTVRQAGVLPPQQIEVLLPVNIVERDAVAVRNPEYRFVEACRRGALCAVEFLLKR